MKTKLHRLLSLLMTVMMLVSMVPSALADESTSNAVGVSAPLAYQTGGGEHDLWPYVEQPVSITSVQGTDGSGNLIGESIRVALSFKIPPQYLQEGNTLLKNWYISKESLSLAEWVTKDWTNIVVNGNLRGTYRITADKVEIVLDDSYLNEAYNGGGVEGSLSATAKWDKGENTDENHWTIKVGDQTYEVYPNGTGGIDVSKEVVGEADSYGYITWKIVVTGTNGGTNGPITLTDTPQSDKFTAEKPVIVEQPEGTENIGWNDGKLTMTLPQLANGATHTIILKTKMTDATKATDGNVTNGVDVRSTDFRNETITDGASAGYHNVIKNVCIEKTGRYNSKGLAKWTITVNSQYADITGMTLTDVLNGADLNWKTGVSDLSISPNTGYNISDDGKTITFTDVNGEANTQKYTITYTTLPTPKYPDPTASTESGYHDENKVTLHTGSSDVDAEKTIDRNMTNDQWLNKTGSFNKDTRIVTWSVTINAGHGDLAGKNFTDVITLEGGNYTFIEMKYNNITCTTLEQLVNAIKAKIQADTVDGHNYNTYTVKYQTKVPAGVTAITNTATVGNVVKNPSVGTGEGPGMITKSGQIDGDSYIKWTITLNPNAQYGAVIPENSELTDTLSANSPATEFASDKQIEVTVTQYNADGTLKATSKNTYSVTDMGKMLEKVNEEVGKNYNTTNSIEIVYWTKIIAPGKVQNNASFAGDDNGSNVDYSFTYGLAKYYESVEELSDEYKLNWAVNVFMPSNSNLGEAVTITDTLTEGNHYLKVADLPAIREAAAQLDVNGEATIEPTGINGEHCTGFIITLPNGLKKNNGQITLNYSSYVAKGSYSGKMVNKVTLQVNSQGEKESSAEMIPSNDLSISKIFTGETNGTGDDATAADLDKLQWTITMPVPAGADGRDITIEDVLPDDIQLTNVVVGAGDDSFSRIATNGSVRSSGSLTGCNGGVSVSTSGQRLTVVYKNSSLAEGTVLKVVVTAKVTDSLRTRLTADPTPVTNRATAKISKNGVTYGTSNTTESTINLVEVAPHPNVEKFGTALESVFNTAEYTIIVNPTGKTFLTTPGGKLTLQDIMTVNVSGTALQDAKDLNLVLAQAVSVTTLDGDPVSGCVIKPEQIEISGNQITATIDMEVPDGTALKLTYRYRIEGTPTYKGSQPIKFSNRVVLNGEEFEGSSTVEPVIKYEYDADVTLDTTGVSFIKVEDGNASLPIEGARFQLTKSGEVVATGETGADGRVVFTWEGNNKWERGVVYTLTETYVPQYWNQDAAPIVFSIGESNATGVYEIFANGTQHYVSNSSKTTSIEGEKIWKDNDNAYKTRPESVTLRLYADGEPMTQTIKVSEETGWKYKLTGLKMYKENPTSPADTIKYTVQEENVPDNYEDTYSENGLTVTNTLTGKTSVKGTKTWDDEDNQDGVRPNTVTVQLQKKVGDEWVNVKGKTDTITETKLTYEFKDLDQYDADGVEIEYRVIETDLSDEYEQSGGTADDNYDLTNGHKPEQIEIHGEKVWEDADNQDGKRPQNVTINLYANGKFLSSQLVTANSEGEWNWSFRNLPKYENGQEIVYTVTENAVTGYDSQVDGNAESGFIVKNTHIPEKISISGQKYWDDANNQDNKRPNSIQVTLMKGTEVIASKTVYDPWRWTFSNLPKYENGQEITYSIIEETVNDYSTGYDGFDIVNHYTPQETSRTVRKIWNDANDQDGLRPDKITVQLKADGEACGEPVTLNEDNGWSYTWTGLPVNRPIGNTITYSVEEIVEVKDYTTTYSADTFTIENEHTPETIEISGSKTWDDADDQDGQRPGSITINLLADDEIYETEIVTEADGWSWKFTDLPKYKDHGKEIVYTIAEEEIEVDEGFESYEAEVNGFDVTNHYTPVTIDISGSKTWDDANDQDGQRPVSIAINLLADGDVIKTENVTADENGDWSWKFENLPKYKDHGKAIDYTITEEEIEVDEGFEGYEAEVNGFDVTNHYTPETIDISGSKIWDDADNQDGVRPESITINLLADGKEVAEKTVTEADSWNWTFNNLPKYRDHGVEIVYTISEDEVSEYTTTYAKTETGYDVTNSYTPEETGRTVQKIWLDNDDQDGVRPESIMVQLLADGEKYGEPVELNAENDWTYTWTKLPVNQPVGQKILYTVEEIGEVEGYITSYSDDTFTITNTHEVEKTTVEGSKTWNDADDQDGVRPESITINLLADGEQIASKTVTEADGWSWKFEDLPKYKDHGTEIVYTITEEAVDGYETEVKGYDVTNSHVPETTEVEGSKTWNDANDQDGKRPESITINLLADGEQIASKTVTEADGWSWKFEDLPKYKDHGTEIVYTITEEAVDGYETVVNGYDVTNTHVPGTVAVSGSKTWNDANNQDGVRPESITINLLADGEKIASKTVTEADGWSWSFANLPEYANGKLIAYTITEDAVAEYETAVNGYDVINTHVPETIEISGRKTWADSNNADGIRPRSITINLLANGEQIESKTVTRADGWSWTFADMPKYANGVEIVYTISETPVAGYRTVVNGFNVTNRHVPETTPEPTPSLEPTPTPVPTPTIPPHEREEVERASRKPVEGAIVGVITILDDAVPLFGGRGTGDHAPYVVGGLSIASLLLLAGAYIDRKRSRKHSK
ncbi:MAG: Cna B-type domain-containing protein [Clostridia bacterium]|nr:Cna B-type domain-containing protein [Clostridia bacterium]